MLDTTVQMKLICLLKELKQTEPLTYVFISHDLDLVRYMADEAGIPTSGKDDGTGDGAAGFAAAAEKCYPAVYPCV